MEDEGFAGCGRRSSFRALKAMTYLSWSKVQSWSLIFFAEPFWSTQDGRGCRGHAGGPEHLAFVGDP